MIDRLAHAWSTPRRWDTVTFRAPDDENRLSVKRVVGLPGERIEFRHGDVFADGRRLRKSLSQLREIAILVHDHGYQPGSGENLPPRWRGKPGPSATSGAWHQVGDRLEFDSIDGADQSLEWLVYHHWPGYAGSLPRAQSSEIVDNYGYNQQLSRPLNAVRDIMLSCRVRTSGPAGCLAFEIADRVDLYRVELRLATEEIVLLYGPRQLKRLALPNAAFAQGVLVELALCDGQVLFGIDRKELLREICPPAAGGESTAPESESRLAIGAAGVRATVDRLQVSRDIHYLPPVISGRIRRSFQRIGPSEVFVVGDNVPISRDSRHWQHPGLPVASLLGRVHSRW
jgi:hypothetical protein